MGISSILSMAWKVVKSIPRYAFSDGTTVITQARKKVISANPNIGKSIFSYPMEKAKAGLEAFTKDIKNFKPKRSIWQDILRLGESLKNAPKVGLRYARMVAHKAGTNPTLWSKASGILKAFGKVGKKIPIIGTIITLGFEAHDIYSAFKDGGFKEGLKQLGKSALKIGVSALVGAIGTAIGGPVGGIIGYAVGDWLVNKVTGGSYLENHPEPEDAKTQQQQAQQEQKPLTPDDIIKAGKDDAAKKKIEEAYATAPTPQGAATPTLPAAPSIPPMLVMNPTFNPAFNTNPFSYSTESGSIWTNNQVPNLNNFNQNSSIFNQNPERFQYLEK